MDIVAVAASYGITLFSTAVCIGIFIAEIYPCIRRGEPTLTRFNGEFATIIVLTVALAWIVRGIMDDPLVAQLFFGVVALWLAAMIWWLYDTLRQEKPTKSSTKIMIITEIEWWRKL
jgi:hypothetical protein